MQALSTLAALGELRDQEHRETLKHDKPLMPDGLKSALKPQDVADLIAFMTAK